MGQKRPAPKGLLWKAPWQRRSTCTGQPAGSPKSITFWGAPARAACCSSPRGFSGQSRCIRFKVRCSRLAIVPMVLEARGLDVTPVTIARFEAAGDLRTARILQRILDDEVRHVGLGTSHFTKVCAERGDSAPKTWQMLVTRYFRGAIKPPFNDSARRSAGLSYEFMEGVA